MMSSELNLQELQNALGYDVGDGHSPTFDELLSFAQRTGRGVAIDVRHPFEDEDRRVADLPPKPSKDDGE